MNTIVGFEVEGYFRRPPLESADSCPVGVDGHRDGSLRERKLVGKARFYGVELVTRPKPVKEALADLKRIFSWMVKTKASTDAGCGLHINVGCPGQFPSMTKVLAASRSLEVARMFDRQRNTWCSVVSHQASAAVKDKVSEYVRSVIGPDVVKTAKFLETVEPAVVGKAVIDAARGELEAWADRQSKGFAVAHRGSQLGPYFEFRTPGGKDYHRRFKDVAWATNIFVKAVEGACV